ncbi:cytochrome p450 family 4 [Holotrichia oblita]|uniref:Cytochrome p450 family 4 n=1 Tax=Holotrichia oblita TaxID=644536 RepID=A0ACB9TWB8_HOLOL|nr:cytochrome p450 family 4 [Holotrichia oblita]
MESVLNTIKKFTRDVIAKAEAERQDSVVNEKSKIHLIDILFDNKLSGETLNDQINTFILAGHDTVAQAMGFTLYELSRRSAVQQKLLEEIQSIAGKDPNADITYKDLQEMKYLEAVVKESMRLHVIVPVIERKISHDIQHNGIRYPKDTTFMFNIDGIHKSEKYFANPKEYNPNRFMPENAHLILKNTFVPFSVGPRDCIGKLYAMLEIKFFVAKCIQKFELLPVENHNLKMLGEIVNKSITGTPVIFKERPA